MITFNANSSQLYFTLTQYLIEHEKYTKPRTIGAEFLTGYNKVRNDGKTDRKIKTLILEASIDCTHYVTLILCLYRQSCGSYLVKGVDYFNHYNNLITLKNYD